MLHYNSVSTCKWWHTFKIHYWVKIESWADFDVFVICIHIFGVCVYAYMCVCVYLITQNYVFVAKNTFRTSNQVITRCKLLVTPKNILMELESLMERVFEEFLSRVGQISLNPPLCFVALKLCRSCPDGALCCNLLFSIISIILSSNVYLLLYTGTMRYHLLVFKRVSPCRMWNQLPI